MAPWKSYQLEAYEFDQFSKGQVWMLLVEKERQLRYHFSVGLGFEMESLTLEESVQRLEIGDDAFKKT